MRMVLGLRSFTSRSRSAPRMTGIFWSLTMTSTRPRPMMFSASRASVVVCSVYWPRNSMASERRMRSSSSTSSSEGLYGFIGNSSGRGCQAGRGGWVGRRQRQADHELGALARHRGDVDGAAVRLHDLVADRQAQAGALADRLGGEERIED